MAENATDKHKQGGIPPDKRRGRLTTTLTISVSGNNYGVWGDSGWQVDPETRCARVALDLGRQRSKQMRHLQRAFPHNSCHFFAGKEVSVRKGQGTRRRKKKRWQAEPKKRLEMLVQWEPKQDMVGDQHECGVLCWQCDSSCPFLSAAPRPIHARRAKWHRVSCLNRRSLDALN